MAKNTEKSTLKTIERWRDELEVPLHIHAGAMVQAKWGKGKEVSKYEYEKAIADFLNTTPDEKTKRRK